MYPFFRKMPQTFKYLIFPLPYHQDVNTKQGRHVNCGSMLLLQNNGKDKENLMNKISVSPSILKNTLCIQWHSELFLLIWYLVWCIINSWKFIIVHNALCFHLPNQVNIALTACLYMIYMIYNHLALAWKSDTMR